jgi:hypothetical protein
VTVDTDKDVVVVHDGSTAGGIPLAKEASVLPLAGGTMTGDVSRGTNVKAKFGADDDLQIYHDGSHSYINGDVKLTGGFSVENNSTPAVTLKDTGNAGSSATPLVNYKDSAAGDLGYVGFGSSGNSQLYVATQTDASVNLSHNNSVKLATTSTGVDVTGSVTCDGFTSTGIDDNATSTAITIDASENVGIGTANGDVTGDGTASRTYVSIIGTGNRGRLNLGSTAADGADGGALSFVNGVNQIASVTSDTTPGSQTAGSLTIQSTGAIILSPTSNVTLNTGNLVIGTSGKGIDFSATSDGSGTMTSEVLDDYETGTWTPVYAATTGAFSVMTMQVITATYTKIGNKVLFQANFRTNGVTIDTAAGQLYIAGLPFTASGQDGSISIGGAIAFAGDVPSSGRAVTGTTNLYLDYRANSNGGTVACNPADLTVGVASAKNYMQISGQYHI